jgi:hypothetical protein
MDQVVAVQDLWPPLRLRPPGTVLGAQETLTTVTSYVKYFLGPDNISGFDGIPCADLWPDEVRRPESEPGARDPVGLGQLQRVLEVAEAVVAVLRVAAAAGVQRAHPDDLVRVHVDVERVPLHPAHLRAMPTPGMFTRAQTTCGSSYRHIS